MADEKVKGDVDKVKQDVKDAAKDAGAAVKDAVHDEHAKADAEVKAAVADATGAVKKVEAYVAPAAKSHAISYVLIAAAFAAGAYLAAVHFHLIK